MRVLRVTDLGDDRLEILGADDDGQEFTASGWVSAMEHHYEPEHYRSDGHRHPGAQPRPMTTDERERYWRSLLEAQQPRRTVLYEAPDEKEN